MVDCLASWPGVATMMRRRCMGEASQAQTLYPPWMDRGRASLFVCQFNGDLRLPLLVVGLLGRIGQERFVAAGERFTHRSLPRVPLQPLLLSPVDQSSVARVAPVAARVDELGVAARGKQARHDPAVRLDGLGHANAELHV